MTDFIHKTVMLQEAVEYLNCQSGKIYIDATAGGGGHSAEISKKIQPDGKLFAFDVDPDAIQAATTRLAGFEATTEVVKSSYTRIPEVLKDKGIEKITGGVLFDLGTSYHQVTSEEKGFSFSRNSDLDMRFNPEDSLSAYDIVNSYSEKDLKKIFSDYGEERYSGRIARNIVEKRIKQPIKTTFELAELIKKCTPGGSSRIHPATRVFQALRMAVNSELESIEKTLNRVVHLLAKDARIVVISFHSLEDRLVKNTFKYHSTKCKCPPREIICKCEDPILKVITKKPLLPKDSEIKDNPPSRSAKMRVAERI